MVTVSNVHLIPNPRHVKLISYIMWINIISWKVRISAVKIICILPAIHYCREKFLEPLLCDCGSNCKFLTNWSQLLSDFLKISKEWFVQANSISSHFAVYQLKKARKKSTNDSQRRQRDSVRKNVFVKEGALSKAFVRFQNVQQLQ